VAAGDQPGQVMPDEGRSEQFGDAVADGPVADRVHGAADSRGWVVVNHDDKMPGLQGSGTRTGAGAGARGPLMPGGRPDGLDGPG
jgi:hypothetical protein